MSKYNKNLEEILSKELDTRDKAFMFFKIKFPFLVSRIDLEGSSSQRAFNILSEFEKLGLIKELEDELKIIFWSKN